MHFNKIHLIELSLIRLGRDVKSFATNNTPYCIVGEAKTSTTQMKKQIEKYIKTKFFNECFEIHPSKSSPSDSRFGLITIGADFKIKVIQRNSPTILLNTKKQEGYLEWLSNYIKYYLIANLTNDEFNQFYYEKNKKKISGVKDIVNFINLLSYNEILTKIEEIS